MRWRSVCGVKLMLIFRRLQCQFERIRLDIGWQGCLYFCQPRRVAFDALDGKTDRQAGAGRRSL